MITVKMTAPEDAIFNIPAFLEYSQQAVDNANRKTKKILDDTKKDFSADSQFEFAQGRLMAGMGASASTWTDNENWIRLNQGTEGHIVGAGGKLMSFLPEYRAKTRPFTPRSRSGGGSGTRQFARGPWRVRGIEPRGFIITAYSLVRGSFHKDVNAAFTLAMRK